MKNRNGFVSNSSSSSFIVFFDKKPKSEDEIMEILFPNQERDDHISTFDCTAHLGDVAHQVSIDLVNQKRMTKTELSECISSGYESFMQHADPKDIKTYKELRKRNEVFSNNFWKEYHLNEDRISSEENKKKIDNYHNKLNALWEEEKKLITKMTKDTVNVIYKNSKGKFIAKFNYSDNDGPFYVLMEHGGVFRGLKHIRISHH